MEKLVERMANGDITRREWVLASREVIKGDVCGPLRPQ